MFNSIKIPAILLTLALLIFLPKASYAWEGQHQHGRDEGRSHHRHDFRSYANEDLTLETGMDNIDSRVLIAGDPDQTPVDEDQPPPAPAVELITVPAQLVSSNGDDSYIVKVPNKAGGYTAVIIKKWGDGYVGPQGELYYPFPQISQLKAMYGI